ncbi:hypothetical protein KIH86_07750 [Paenibacillus sp. HN-1]|uniref:hypothetical protein n=1 Tax=Paenibacillus TaxID=44249 RepID=UPI001CA95413|nr:MULTISPECIES: hypothetical protein [Paenibacillus]MBY9078596.1 hypothetical protein [Paenibacillus sp. CGMCC 1.18879]MBY9084132.1 hypothetical protein [Paenibacillus sinensis]
MKQKKFKALEKFTIVQESKKPILPIRTVTGKAKRPQSPRIQDQGRLTLFYYLVQERFFWGCIGRK